MKKLKYFILGFMVSTLLLTNPAVKAADFLQSIKVVFSNMPIYIEGQKAQIKEKPMIYEGTTYLPMRSIAKALGKEVRYEADSRSIYIYTKGNEPVMDNKKDDNVEDKIDSKEFNLYNISIGDDKEHVINKLGDPDRQDASEYGFTWFIYNKDYKNYIQVGIKDSKVVGLYTNSANWQSKKGIKFGSTYLEVQNAYKTPLTYIQKGNTKYYFSNSIKESNTFLIDDAYTTIFYDMHKNQTVTSVLIIEKDTELTLNGFYGEGSKELIKAYEKQIFDLSNAVRVREDLKPYSWDDLASKSSRLHSEDMAKGDFFAHTNLRGESPFVRMNNQGIRYNMAAENIAAGQNNAIYAHEGWMNSKGHRTNILGKCERLGVGVYFGGAYSTYFTQNFYTPR
ncbi:MAG: copper amine oxidase [Epulopiscium sp.]|nr:copper amine oxidase [Candidatus Epulonipiscium sp.]